MTQACFWGPPGVSQVILSGLQHSSYSETRSLQKSRREPQNPLGGGGTDAQQRRLGRSSFSSILGWRAMAHTLHLFFLHEWEESWTFSAAKKENRVFEEFGSCSPGTSWSYLRTTPCCFLWSPGSLPLMLRTVLVITLRKLPRLVFQPLVPSSLSCSVRIFFFFFFWKLKWAPWTVGPAIWKWEPWKVWQQ